MDTQTAQTTDRQAVIDKLGITLEAEPAHSNPNMDSDTEMDHWSVNLTRPNRPSMTLFYSMGIGHRRLSKPVKPQLIDILYCLISDSVALNYTFEEWCNDLGYDTDSRKAERAFHICSDQAKQVKRLLGNDFEAAQEALQDLGSAKITRT